MVCTSSSGGQPCSRGVTRTIHNGVELDRFERVGANHRGQYAGEGRIVLGFAGQLVPRKGLDLLVEALPRIVAEFPGVLLLVVGCAPAGEEEYEAKCRARIESLQLGRNVEFVGFRRDIDAWMRTFDLFVLPTRSEPFGKVIIEAQAVGCPVVATRVGGIPEIVSHPELGILIPPEDPAALAGAILEVLRDPARREALAEAGCRHARENFSIGAMIDKLQDVYADVLEGNSRTVSK